MTKKELTQLKTAIAERKNLHQVAINTFGANSNEAWIIENELNLLENLFKEPIKAPVKKRKPRKDKGKRRKDSNNLNVMYIKKDGNLFIQLSSGGEYVKTTGQLVYVNVFDYIIYGLLVKRTSTGIILENWRLEKK